jgi:hypothetical protein
MNCANCRKELERVFDNPQRRRTDNPPYLRALVIEFRGGYGMYFDERPQDFILCEGCANLVIDSLPPGLRKGVNYARILGG